MISGANRYPLQLILFMRLGYPPTENAASLERRDNSDSADLDITKTEREANIQPNSVADDRRRNAQTRSLSSATVPTKPNRATFP